MKKEPPLGCGPAVPLERLVEVLLDDALLEVHVVERELRHDALLLGALSHERNVRGGKGRCG